MLLAFLIALAAATASPGSTDGGICNPPTRVTDFGPADAIGYQWNAATRTFAYGRPQGDGHYAMYLADADGRNERPLTHPSWPANRHQFPAAWHPTGRYLVALVEKAKHKGSSADAIPGYGAYTDYWAITPDGRRVWKLVDMPDDYDYAITHAAFSPDGTKFVWTQRHQAPRLLDMNLLAGAYLFNVSEFIVEPEPHLGITRSFQPGGVLQGGEVESIAADNATIAFYSTLATKNLLASRIYTLNIDSGELRELTTESWAQAPTFTPDGRSIVYTTGAQADIFPFRLQGADWWIMNVDGSNKRRLTFMNKRNDPQSVNDFRLAGSLTFLSNQRFIGGVMTQSFGLVGKSVRVDCN
jgi:Tol biopolymer transport system component